MRLGQKMRFYGGGGFVPLGVQTNEPEKAINNLKMFLLSFSPVLLLAAPLVASFAEKQLKKRGLV